jgi:hypothetical protein
MRRLTKKTKGLVVSAAFAAIALSAPAARAEKRFHIISPGFLWGVTKQLNDAPAWGAVGGELTYAYLFYQGEQWAGVGAFAQAQTVGFHHLRAALGPQVTYAIGGLELGPYIEAGEDAYATTIGLHASPFVTVGLASAALRVGIPVATTSEGARYGVDLGVVFTLKLPFAPTERLGYLPIAWIVEVEK